MHRLGASRGRRGTRWATLLLAVVVACGGGSSATRDRTGDPARRGAGGGHPDDEDDDVTLQTSRGVLDPEQIRAIVEPHSNDYSACYISRVGDRRWLGGKVQLKWELDDRGAVVSVHVDESDLGAWPVEKCLLAQSRRLSFPPPRGGATDFTVPLEFSATGKAKELDEAQSAVLVVGHLGKLAACRAEATPGGAAEPAEVALTLYVGAGGQVLSSGFAVDEVEGFTDAWADCAHATLSTWKLGAQSAPVTKLFVRYRPAPVTSNSPTTP